jgi:hypothetical protein
VKACAEVRRLARSASSLVVASIDKPLGSWHWQRMQHDPSIRRRWTYGCVHQSSDALVPRPAGRHLAS